MSALRFARREPCRIVGTAVAFPTTPPHGVGARSNRDVVAKHAAMGRRGPRTDEELDELAKAMGDTLGVETRHWAHELGEPFRDDEPTTVDLAVHAIERALAEARIAPSALGAVLCATSTPAKITGANAPQVASRLGARCAAFDVRAGCSGGLLALHQACMIAASTDQPVAVSGADTFSKITPEGIPLAALAFGDAAGAAIVVSDRTQAGGALSAAFASDGTLGTLAAAPAPFPVTHARLDQNLYVLAGDPEELAQRSPALYAAIADEALSAAALTTSDVDLFIPHQTSRPAVEHAAQAIGVDLDKTLVTVARHANCGTAGIYLALDHARASGRFVRGRTILLAALGGGLAWGAMVFRP
jgi:3-oxoacyl-[acyl-carrier-protein] synthase III